MRLSEYGNMRWLYKEAQNNSIAIKPESEPVPELVVGFYWTSSMYLPSF
jgi:hypothetical protein